MSHDRHRRRSRRRSSDGCANTCDIIDAGFDIFTLWMACVAVAGYFTTAPVREGRWWSRPVLRLIRSYQANVSAHRPAVCNLTPTCSDYGYRAIRAHGLRGLLDLRARLRACTEAGVATPEV